MLKKLLIGLIVVCLFGIGGQHLYRSGWAEYRVPPLNNPDLSVLIIGNSMTRSMAQSDGLERLLREADPTLKDIYIASAPIQRTLDDHAARSKSWVPSPLKAYLDESRHWDAVVLQAQSQSLGFRNGNPDRMSEENAVLHFVLGTDLAGKRPDFWLIEGWGYQNGDPFNPQLWTDFGHMQGDLIAGTRQVAAPTGTSVIHAGTAFQAFCAEQPKAECSLYNGNKYPSEEGKFLVAAATARAITGRTLPRDGFRPKSVSPTAAKKIRATVNLVGAASPKADWSPENLFGRICILDPSDAEDYEHCYNPLATYTFDRKIVVSLALDESKTAPAIVLLAKPLSNDSGRWSLAGRVATELEQQTLFLEPSYQREISLGNNTLIKKCDEQSFVGALTTLKASGRRTSDDFETGKTAFGLLCSLDTTRCVVSRTLASTTASCPKMQDCSTSFKTKDEDEIERWEAYWESATPCETLQRVLDISPNLEGGSDHVDGRL